MPFRIFSSDAKILLADNCEVNLSMSVPSHDHHLHADLAHSGLAHSGHTHAGNAYTGNANLPVKPTDPLIYASTKPFCKTRSRDAVKKQTNKQYI
jgi:hypothetical protein